MRILIVSNYFESHRGGIEIVAGRIAAELAALGHEVSWAAADASEAPCGSPLRSIPLPAWNGIEAATGVPMPVLRWTGVRNLLAAIRDADALIIHDALYTMSLVALFATRIQPKPAILIQHIGEVPYRRSLLRLAMKAANWLAVRPALTAADRVVFISDTVRGYFEGTRYSHPPLTLFNGVDTRRFRPAEPSERQALRQRLQLRDERRAALFVGRFVEKKGLDHIREAARLRPQVDFMLAGWGPVAPEQWELPNVRVLGSVSQDAMAELYQAADMLVLPSVGEGLPLVLQEALAAGLPVICGNETAAADPVATRLLTGIAIDTARPDVTGARLAAAIDDMPRYCFGEWQARADFARQRYCWNTVGRNYASLIGELVAAQSPQPAASPRREAA